MKPTAELKLVDVIVSKEAMPEASAKASKRRAVGKGSAFCQKLSYAHNASAYVQNICAHQPGRFPPHYSFGVSVNMDTHLILTPVSWFHG